MAEIKPFKFHLTKISGALNQLVADLLDFLPASGARESFHLAIRKTLQQYLSDVRYYLAAIEPVTFPDFFTALPNPCCVGVLGMEPFKQKAFVELDPLLGNLVIDKLLGGKGEEWGELRPLTETEQGVIEFLLLKLLHQIHKLSGENAKLHFRLEQMTLEPAKLKIFQKEKDSLICLKIHVALLNQSGFFKIYLPTPWILEGFLKDLPEDRDSRLHQILKENLKHFEALPLELSGSLGEATLTCGDLKNLETGDVVLFDESGVSKEGDRWQGEVQLVAGPEGSGGFRGLWKGFEEKGRCEITGALKGGKVYA